MLGNVRATQVVERSFAEQVLQHGIVVDQTFDQTSVVAAPIDVDPLQRAQGRAGFDQARGRNGIDRGRRGLWGADDGSEPFLLLPQIERALGPAGRLSELRRCVRMRVRVGRRGAGALV